ncbi:MAG: DNA translocase FtsK [Achromobacter sp.]|uniref:DNA translocase FtsK n=1 Tax=Achromobacter sp. TaxID=134375 RepID=UPI003CFE6016
MGGEKQIPGSTAAPTAGQLPLAGGEDGGDAGDVIDPLYTEAVMVVRKHGRPSISLIQRHLQIGYNRAAHLLESMELAGLVTPIQSNGSRELRA